MALRSRNRAFGKPLDAAFNADTASTTAEVSASCITSVADFVICSLNPASARIRPAVGDAKTPRCKGQQRGASSARTAGGDPRSGRDKNRGGFGPFHQPTVKCPADPSTGRALRAFTAVPPERAGRFQQTYNLDTSASFRLINDPHPRPSPILIERYLTARSPIQAGSSACWVRRHSSLIYMEWMAGFGCRRAVAEWPEIGRCVRNLQVGSRPIPGRSVDRRGIPKPAVPATRSCPVSPSPTNLFGKTQWGTDFGNTARPGGIGRPILRRLSR